MNDKDKTPNAQHEAVVEHPQLKRDRAFALFLARSHARNHGRPPPDPATIRPIGLTRLKPAMSRDEMKRNLLAAFKANGITVHPGKKISKEEISHD